MMKMRLKITTFLMLLFCTFSFAQMSEYHYKRPLKEIKETWHTVNIPIPIFEKVNANLADIRIYGITSAKDTLEAPYILKSEKEKEVIEKVRFNLINESHTKNGYYYTFETNSEKAINEIELNFLKQNFDWKIQFEGSQNQQEWFTIVDNYRVLSIVNAETNYQFTKVTFPTSKYKYIRLLVKSEEDPQFSTAQIAFKKNEKGSYNSYDIANFETIQNEKEHTSTLNINLMSFGLVSSVQLNVKNAFDYYRPITIEYLADSTKTEKGWIYNYKTLSRGTLSSIEKNEFKFKESILKNFRIHISNGNNTPLTIDDVIVKGNKYQLVSRFTEPASYFLTYGNKKALKPNYDISRFISKIPDSLSTVGVGVEQIIGKKKPEIKEPLFKNKKWLWGVMLVIIALLGWFSIKMIKSKSKD